MIYVCPVHLNEVELQYYSSLLKSYRTQEESTAGPSENTLSKRRFMIVTPEAVDYFPVKLSILLFKVAVELSMES